MSNTPTHQHIYRAVPGAGWACTTCGRPTITPPPMEQRASYHARLKAEMAAEIAAGRVCGDHERPVPCAECQ